MCECKLTSRVPVNSLIDNLFNVKKKQFPHLYVLRERKKTLLSIIVVCLVKVYALCECVCHFLEIVSQKKP